MNQVWTWRWMKMGSSRFRLLLRLHLLACTGGMMGRWCWKAGAAGLCSKTGLHAWRDLRL